MRLVYALARTNAGSFWSLGEVSGSFLVTSCNGEWRVTPPTNSASTPARTQHWTAPGTKPSVIRARRVRKGAPGPPGEALGRGTWSALAARTADRDRKLPALTTLTGQTEFEISRNLSGSKPIRVPADATIWAPAGAAPTRRYASVGIWCVSTKPPGPSWGPRISVRGKSRRYAAHRPGQGLQHLLARRPYAGDTGASRFRVLGGGGNERADAPNG